MSIQSKAQKLQETKSSHSSQYDPSYEKILEEAKINKICFSPDEPTYDFNKSYLEEIEIINSSNNVVKRFVHILSGNQLAIKQINIPHNRNNEKDYDKKLRQLIREIQSLNLLRDAPKVVQFYGACISEKQVWICMELMDMSLKDFYIKIHQESKHFPEELIGYIVVDILDALEFCQQSKIMYRDIKPDNLMLKKSTGEIKLTDFGESRFSEDGIAQTNQIGSTKYWPPERFTLEPYDVRSDVWSFGISLLETILGKYPYENINEEVKKNTIILQNLIKDTDPNRLVEMISNDYSKELEEFIGLCLKPLNERPAYEELKKSEFYRRYANKTKEDVKRLIGHLNITTSDYGTGSYYLNELDQNIESGSSEENTSEDSTQLGSGSSMEAYVKSECDYDLLEVDSEESTSSSSSSSSETSLGFASAMHQTYLVPSQQYSPNSGLISDTPIFAQSNQQHAHHYPQMPVQRTMVVDAQPFNSPAQNFHVQKSQVFGQQGSNVPVEQSYSVPRQNLAQNSRPTSGNVASPNQGAASSSNSSTSGADSMDTTNTNATRNNTKRPRNPIKRDQLKQREHEQKHRDTKRIYLRNLQQTLQELINSHKELQKKVQEHIESQETNQRQILLTNQQILNILQQEQPSDGPISSQRMTTSLRINKVMLGASQTTGSNNRPRNIHASNNEPLNAQIGIQSNLQTTLNPRTSQIMHDNSYSNERSMSLDPAYTTMSETASLGLDTLTPVNIDVEEFDRYR